MKKSIISILISAIWISISEFVRNEVILKNYWIEHYQSMGLIFPSHAINGIIWGVWSLCYAISIFIVSRKFSLLQTFLFSWFNGFILMWLVIGNMGVLPFGILIFAIPLSLLESYLATFIIFKMSPANELK